MQVSIIIPTLNEVSAIAQTISRTRALGDCEVIVVDGGSDDGTLEAAQAADLCLPCDRGRAVQQNSGARASHGDLLIFLHADCWLEPGALAAVRSTFDDSRTIAACFQQTIDSTGMIYRLIEAGNNLRVRTVQWAYGDQGLVVRREVFDRVGGFPQLPLMEDLYLMKRLKCEGRVRLIDHPLHVHPRRWQQSGPVRQTLRNWLFIALVHVGVSPATLARYYAHVR